MSRAIRILVVGNHLILRAGLRSLLQGAKGLQVVGEARLGQEVLTQAAALTPDVGLFDLIGSGENGIQSLRAVGQATSDTALAVVGHTVDQAFVSEALSAGVRGVFAADSTPAELIQGITSVADGKRYLAPSVAEAALQGLVERLNGVSSPAPLEVLSPRERDVMSKIADGCTSSQIARELHISVHTVDTHRRKLMEKLNLHSLAAVIRFALQHGLTALPKEPKDATSKP